MTRVFAVARADFLERTRRYSFLITLLVMIWGAYVFLPPNHARYATFELGGHRGIYNSAWVGSLVAMLSSVFLSIAGFYLTKNTVERDRRTGVGQILAATPLGRRAYVFGKALSNFAVLSAMVAALAVASLGMQLVRGESRSIDLIALLSPFLLITLPALALTAAAAVLFEVFRLTRGGFGNVLFYLLFMVMFGVTTAGLKPEAAYLDPLGKDILIRDAKAACAVAYPEYQPTRDGMSVGFHFRSNNRIWDLKTFEWKGGRWSARDVAARLAWMLVAMGLVMIAAWRFDRFDEARSPGREKRPRRGAQPALLLANGADAEIAVANGAGARLTAPAREAPARRSLGARLLGATRATALAPLIGAEFALLTRGQNFWWYLIAAALIALSLFLPLAAVRMPVLPLLWVWPVLIWSAMGSREVRNGTDGLLFSSARPLRRQLPAAYLAGVGVAVLIGAGVALRFTLARDFASLGAWGAGALFIPAFALASGVWTGGRKMFEILYLVLWYGGPMNQTPELDFMGVTAAGAASRTPMIFLGVALALLILAAVGRTRQIRS